MITLNIAQKVERDGMILNATFALEISREKLVSELERLGFEASESNIDKFGEALIRLVTDVDEDEVMSLFMADGSNVHSRDQGLNIFWAVLDEGKFLEEED